MNYSIKNKLNEWAEKDSGRGYFPSKPEPLNAVYCESRSPLGDGKSETSHFSCTEWVNGEGFDIGIFKHNEISKAVKEKTFSLSTTDIDGILRCLGGLEYFE